ncbi:Molybdopterin biosynthesis enzyme [Halorhabdus sp. SVX81]|uniref:molybdopterin molybdotransferase MoeA n=1 Tax=Halorhabdus sp. SVX81 TaxID=2978283 RepID=UPI0023DAA6FA|nr:molybdopterin molybdotransferase MoeA [Halorhabdus sp. SVX81]WEL17552.1 Molybdopterin biosynthesis enzyme [Halorhabdus sp. SVX81]
MSGDRHEAGFKRQASVDAAREQLRSLVEPVDRTERMPTEAAGGRVIAAEITPKRPVPHYDRAAMDGFAVTAEETVGASERAPARLEAAESMGPGQAVRVHTGSEMPDTADAVVRVEDVTERTDGLAIETAVTPGENVAPTGEDVAADTTLFEPGDRLRPSDLGVLKATGIGTVPVYERPEIAVIPTGEEVVESDPGPGEIVETNGLVVTRLVERWGGDPRYRDIVTDDQQVLADAIERDLDADVIVTTGGSSVGERDLLPEVLAELGDVAVHGVAHKPGHPVGFGSVEETPVLMLPGYPVSALVNAVQLLYPAVAWAGNREPADPPTTAGELTRKIASEPGVRSYVRVRHVAEGVEPIRSGGAGVLSSVSAADGWVVVPESQEGIEAGATVSVEDWEWSP